MASTAFETEMDRPRGTTPRTKVEFITKAGVVTDITDWYESGANFEQVRERAPDEIQAGQFDIVLTNEDDMFSEFIVGSLLYGLDYHGAKIRISQGFLLPDSTLEYEMQGVLFIDQLSTDPLESKVTFRCRDLLWRVMDQKIHPRPEAEVPLADAGNVGDGVLAGVAKLPFVTINETWTVTCTTPGADGVAEFSVVGSVSGSIGPATSGVEFAYPASGLRFTIHAGLTSWALSDEFTFDTFQHPEWIEQNAGKIIWSVLTGYDWDSDTIEPFAPLVFDLDHTQSDANTDIDYEAFATVISVIDAIGVFDITGYAPYDADAIQFIQSLIIMFLGSLYTGNDGRIKLTTYVPAVTPHFRTFADSKKNMSLSITRSIDEVINYVSVNYKGSDIWPWSDESIVLDGHFVDSDAVSVAARKKLAQTFDIPWFSPSDNHVQDFASKLIARYKDPPLNVEFLTGMDALLTEIGDRIIVTDEKLGLDAVSGEVTKVVKLFDQNPASVQIKMRQDATTNLVFGAIGSEEAEGDGISPQDDDYNTASAADKQFAYFSKVGNADPPQYFIF